MGAIVVINIKQPNDRARELLDCLRGLADGAQVGAPDDAGKVEVYLSSAYATVEASKASLAELLNGCGDDWRDHLALGWAGEGDWPEEDDDPPGSADE